MEYIKLVIFFCIAVTGVSAAEQQPEWLRDQGKNYPESQYLTAVGKGEDVTAAREDATAKMAENFKLQVDDKTTAPYFRTELSKVLDKTEFASQWHDDMSGQYFVYAVLPRDQAAAGLWEGMRFHDQYTQAQLAFSRRETDHFVSAQSFYKAYLSQMTRAGLFRQAKAIHRKKEPVGPSMTPESLKSDMMRELSQMRVAVDTADKNLALRLRKWLTKSGMFYEKKTPAYRLQAEWAGPNTPAQSDSEYRYNGTLDVTLLRENDKKVIALGKMPVRVTASSAGKANKQLQKQIGKAINKQLLTTLLTYQAPVEPLRGRRPGRRGANPHAPATDKK